MRYSSQSREPHKYLKVALILPPFLDAFFGKRKMHPDVRQKFARQRMLFSQESKCTEVYEQDKKSQKTWRSEKGSFFSRRTPNTCIYLTLKKASGIKYCYLLLKARNLHGCFFNLPVNASICLSNTKPHCVTNLRASTQRCALRVARAGAANVM